MDAAPSTGEIVLSAELAESSGLRPGDRVRISGRAFTVTGSSGDASYGHSPVAWTTLDDWRAIGPAEAATVLLLRVNGDPDLAAADARLNTTALTPGDARSAVPSFSAENGSLQLVRGFLFVISALVMGAFFTVWTIQRRADVAVLKALGASTGHLLRDALAQAVLILAAGAGLGGAIGALAGFALGGGVPFVVSPTTTLFPAAVMLLLGTAGAAVVGPSGSGKSSLLAVAGTLLRPTSGEVIVAGREVTALRPADRARLRRDQVGIVFQQPNLLPSLTALDHDRGEQVVNLLADLTHDRGLATVMVTHDRDQLATADRVHTMTDGRLTCRPRTTTRGHRHEVPS
ncbi:ATP-binding cassette domain-containing protein [Actinomadura algeriensis]|uniref:Uncharacterized protein n=1 Tax=Actinomadura algeriensis TaxID=1679523 RepID=A0ABR9JR77_9ACTN|nr:ATP-binding cassette domain-containing protein [Actinomadura algeriensis]MBE1533081.1 hypothetical protein [Actinomadura algeriensis]